MANNRRILISLIFMFLLLVIPFRAFSSMSTENSFQQDTAVRRVTAIKQPVYTSARLVTDPPVIDGKLDDECWNYGTWGGDFIQWRPRDVAGMRERKSSVYRGGVRVPFFLRPPSRFTGNRDIETITAHH